jgi:hypothetical protein
MKRTRFLLAAMLALYLSLFDARAADDLPEGAKVLDGDILFYSWPYPVVSPDGQWVAYVSRGFVCACNLKNPHPIRLVEVPDTWTHELAKPQYADVGGDWSAAARRLSREEYSKWNESVKHTVIGLQWTPTSDAVVFAYQGYDRAAKKWSSDVRCAALNGTVSTLASMQTGVAYTGAFPSFYLSRNRRSVVIPSYYRPLIWDFGSDGPRATPFLNLVPAATSGRWLGIEKDTRQLVITDEDFEVIERFEFFWPEKMSNRELIWSPNERYVIWKNQVGFDYASNWEGGWIDLKTFEQRAWKGAQMAEKILFTGRDGEIVRIGVEGESFSKAPINLATGYFQVYANGDAEPVDLYRAKLSSLDQATVGRFPDLRFLFCSPGCELFAFTLQRPVVPPVVLDCYLMDRHKNLWRIPGKDAQKYFSPFEVVGFAENGESIIGHDGKRMFSVTVKALQVEENRRKLPSMEQGSK